MTVTVMMSVVAVLLKIIVQPHAVVPGQFLPRQGIGKRRPADAVRGQGQPVEVHARGGAMIAAAIATAAAQTERRIRQSRQRLERDGTLVREVGPPAGRGLVDAAHRSMARYANETKMIEHTSHTMVRHQESRKGRP